MSAAHLLIVLVAVALLAVVHLRFAGGVRAGTLPGRSGGANPSTGALIAAALAATLFALGVVAVPALLGDDEPGTITQPTLTAPTDTDGRTTSVETKTTVPTETTATTTTAPTATRPAPPPPGAVVLARAEVDGATGRLRRALNRLDESRPVVRAAGRGRYRVLLPGLTREIRRRVALRVTAGPATVATARKSEFSPALAVQTRDRRTGAPAARDFTLVVYGPNRDVPNETLPKTS